MGKDADREADLDRIKEEQRRDRERAEKDRPPPRDER